ncbi:hypothetical protein NDI44_22420 [Trichocoleus sp. DQ-A3]|uniref:hypothetical protein n=1 Tax=Cyanophyceae TaxID=3028117 RepID=UPI0016851156|nr:hypothetical protein [Coleofasciculus sp. FACHB-125]MBD1903793.1 hypothetical protein [Coleofasciculus sp. FACHB-125]
MASIGAHVEDVINRLRIRRSELVANCFNGTTRLRYGATDQYLGAPRRCQPLQWSRRLTVGGLLTAAIAFKV